MRRYRARTAHGLALLLVVSILSIVAVITVSFVFAMRLETAAATNFRAAIQAQYIAEAGIAHAKALLHIDRLGTLTDDLSEPWVTVVQGGDVDNNGDGRPDSRWLAFGAPEAPVAGRYAVLVEDEAGKLNVNVAALPNRSPLAHLSGWSPAELSLDAAFSELGLLNAQTLAAALLHYRYGPDGKPGVAGVDDNHNQAVLAGDGIDNDGNGVVDEPGEGLDEPDEFDARRPYGDDQPLTTVEDLRGLAGCDEATMRRLRGAVTLYSYDHNTTLRGQPRLHLPTATPDELVQVFIDAGVANPWRKAVNVVDALDGDLTMSRLTKVSLRLSAPSTDAPGGWHHQGGAYVNDEPGTQPGTWTWENIPNGEYALVVYAVEAGQVVGDVTIAALTQPAMEHGDVFNAASDHHVHVTDGALRVSVRHPGTPGTTVVFGGVELIPTQATAGFQQSSVRGIEAIRINEVMVKPMMTLAPRADQAPGGDWTWSGTGYVNQTPRGGAVGSGRWTWTDLPNGNYYLTIHTGGAASMVGDVDVNGLSQPHMRDGDRFERTATVAVTNGTFRLNIQNNEETGNCALASIELSQQPDAEYVELVNLSNQYISLGGWSLSGPGITGWPAVLPLEATIAPHKFLVLAVDQRDAAPGIDGNGISLETVWGRVPAVQLQFTHSVTPRDDLFKDSPTSGDTIALRDATGYLVDEVEYLPGQVQPYVALEKGDPTATGDTNNNGVDDQWYPSQDASGGTPGAGNNNSGMIERVGQQDIRHTIDEITIANHAPASVGALGRVPSGEAWRTIPVADIAKLADRLTVYGHRLECDGHVTEAGGWQPLLRAAPLTTWFESRTYGDVGAWQWDATDRLVNGLYTLKLYGQEGEALACAIHLADGRWTDWTPSLMPDGRGRVTVGQVAVGLGTPESTPDRTLEIRVRNNTGTETCHLNWVSLTPRMTLPGLLNINTAPRAVLMALPGVTGALADRIIGGRPYGNRGQKQRGIGDLLTGGALGGTEREQLDAFEPIANLITTRSNVFQLIATGQVLDHGRPVAEKRIRTVIER